MKYQKIVIWRVFLPKRNVFSHLHRAYPPTVPVGPTPRVPGSPDFFSRPASSGILHIYHYYECALQEYQVYHASYKFIILVFNILHVYHICLRGLPCQIESPTHSQQPDGKLHPRPCPFPSVAARTRNTPGWDSLPHLLLSRKSGQSATRERTDPTPAAPLLADPAPQIDVAPGSLPLDRQRPARCVALLLPC
jgi:hypothetical protein